MIKTSGFLLVLISLLFSPPGRAQSKDIKSIRAFAKPVLHGKELRGLDGNTVTRNDTALFFYLEIKGSKKPVITAVSYGHRSYSSSVFQLTGNEVKAGINQATGKPVVIKKTPGRSLWMVELHADEKPVKSSSASPKMIIRGKLNNKTFTRSVDKPVWLESDIVG